MFEEIVPAARSLHSFHVLRLALTRLISSCDGFSGVGSRQEGKGMSGRIQNRKISRDTFDMLEFLVYLCPPLSLLLDDIHHHHPVR